MALTAEQQAQLEIQTTIENLRLQNQNASEGLRHANQLEIQAKMTKLEAIRIAQQTLIENRRNQPVDAREITAADITAYANSIASYVNS